MRAAPNEVSRVFLAEGGKPGRQQEVIALAGSLGITVERVSQKQFQQMAGGIVHQNIAAAVSAFAYASFEDILASCQKLGNDAFVLVLDQIQDPHNLGSLSRTAFALGAQALIIPKDRACEVTPTVVKASAGATAHLPIVQVTNLRRAIDELKESGFWIVGAAAGEGKSLATLDCKRALAIVIGSEGEGLRRNTVAACDFLAHIPMSGALGSLNASVAGAIFMYEVVRQRHG